MTNPPSPVKIVQANDGHLDSMVLLHTRAFPGEFLTLLGAGVLRSFYAFYNRQEQGISLVAVHTDSADVLGLVCGGEPDLRRTFVRRCACRLTAGCLRGAVLHNRVRGRLWQHTCQALSRLARQCSSVASSPWPAVQTNIEEHRWSSLLSICSDPDRRGSGIGRLLMEAFRAESQRQGYSLMRLSVHNDNLAAINLYQRCGWTEISKTQTGTYFSRATDH